MKVEVEVAKEPYELAQGLAKFVAAVKAEIEDNGGWSSVDDLPGVISAAVTELLPAVQGMAEVPEEMRGDPVSFGKGLALGLADLAQVFVSKGE